MAVAEANLLVPWVFVRGPAYDKYPKYLKNICGQIMTEKEMHYTLYAYETRSCEAYIRCRGVIEPSPDI